MALTRVAVYERSLHASIERAWENVRDWEHLPWLHAGSFRSIELVEEAGWGWKARIGLHPEDGPEILLELVIESDRRYVSRTLEGVGAGSEIWTRLTPVAADRTDVRVEFLLPDVEPDAAERIGAGYTALYTRLWDEDEAMMQRRSAELVQRADRVGGVRSEPLELGPVATLRERLPLIVEFAGRPFRIVADGESFYAHSTVCPHQLGPLADCPIGAGALRCPWHGYRFDARSGQQLSPSRRLRLAPAPQVEIVAGQARLVPRR
jgi:nitrite reductase/ring-hydroxylating ferredoxin subunit